MQDFGDAGIGVKIAVYPDDGPRSVKFPQPVPRCRDQVLNWPGDEGQQGKGRYRKKRYGVAADPRCRV